MLTFRFTGADGEMTVEETLTSGMVGKEVKLEFSGDWDGMTKTVVFSAGEVCRDVMGAGDVVTIPAEVLEKPLEQLCVGVCGVSKDGRVMPTVRVMGPWIEPGTDPAGDEAMVRSLPEWAQYQARFEELAERVTNSGALDRIPPAMVSFIDDDCRAATYGTLFPVIQELGIPLTVACAPGELEAPENPAGVYMTTIDLQDMHSYGVEVACHHLKQYNMNTYASAEDYAADLDACLAMFEELGISDVSTICYPQGVYVDDLMGVVRERFRMGFGVFRGINGVPYESYFMKRCELFPTNGAYTMNDARALVDRVAVSGGWLIFMTHAWYGTFDADSFRDLVAYIQAKNVEIVGVNEAIARTGNITEIGLFRKPSEDLTEPYFVTDYLGRNSSNGYTAAELSLRTGKVISTSGPVVNVTSGDVEYVVSEKYPISGASSVLVSGWASDGCGIYVFYDDAGNRKEVYYSAKTYADGGECFLNKEVPVPDGATQIVVAGHFRQQMPGLKLVEQGGGTSGADGGYYTVAVTQPDANTAAFDFTPSKSGMTSVSRQTVTLPMGPQGEQGTAGENGQDGFTPVRGTDYWTDADKAEIKSYVEEAILGGAW